MKTQHEKKTHDCDTDGDEGEGNALKNYNYKQGDTQS
jgi:hypothetical protein